MCIARGLKRGLWNCPSRTHFKGKEEKMACFTCRPFEEISDRAVLFKQSLWPLTKEKLPFPSLLFSHLLFPSFRRTDCANHCSPHLLRSGCHYFSPPLLEWLRIHLPTFGISSLQSTLPTTTRANLVKHRSGPIPLRIKSLGGSHLTFLSHLWCLHSASCTLHPALHHAHAPAGLQMENLCLLSACLSSTHPSGFSSSLSNIPSVPLRTSQTYLSLI